MGEDQVPTKLYRYRGYTDADLLSEERRARIALEIERAKHGQVWFSPLSAQNDPFDTNPCYLKSPRWEVQKLIKEFHRRYGILASFSGSNLAAAAAKKGLSRKALKSVKKKTYVDATFDTSDNLLKTTRTDMTICCFSASDSDILMWSYYASSHSSFCFRFERSESQAGEARSKLGRVKYTSERPTISTIQIILNAIERAYPEFKKLSHKDRDTFTDSFILTKSDHWSHEKEWRALRRFPSKSGYHSISPYRLTGIIMGCRASSNLEKYLNDVSGHGIDVLHATVDENMYKLHVK